MGKADKNHKMHALTLEYNLSEISVKCSLRSGCRDDRKLGKLKLLVSVFKVSVF